MMMPQANSQQTATQAYPARFHFEDGEVLNLNKPMDWTSFDVVKKIKMSLKIKKVGHAGTLDPFATGVLIVCTGRATKRVAEFVEAEKEYVARIELGKATDTFDRTGHVLESCAVNVNRVDIEEVCSGFRGQIQQVPPMYSALKIGGERLYKKARRGEVVARQPRKVTITDLELQNLDLPYVTLRIVCSKGTYIRVLAKDIGDALGCGACVDQLTRTRVGSYRIEDAFGVTEFTKRCKLLDENLSESGECREGR